MRATCSGQQQDKEERRSSRFSQTKLTESPCPFFQHLCETSTQTETISAIRVHLRGDDNVSCKQLMSLKKRHAAPIRNKQPNVCLFVCLRDALCWEVTGILWHRLDPLHNNEDAWSRLSREEREIIAEKKEWQKVARRAKTHRVPDGWRGSPRTTAAPPLRNSAAARRRSAASWSCERITLLAYCSYALSLSHWVRDPLQPSGTR